MRFARSMVAVAAISFVATVPFATTAGAAPISKCDAAKKKCIGKYVAAQLGCHAKAESKGIAVDPACLAKGVAKITGGGKGCFDKNESKVPNDCTNVGNVATELAAADQLIDNVVSAVDPAYPAPTLTKCGAARKKCVGKKAAGLMGCSAKASKDGVGDPTCAPKISAKFDDPAKGCDPKAVAKGPDCLGTATTGLLETLTDGWAGGAEARIEDDGSGGECGDGSNDPGEACDATAPSSGWAQCGPDFTCVSCNCACPSTVVFSGDATAPESLLDTGWTGISHRAPIISNGDVTVALSACAGASRPCGQCTVTGPIANPNAGTGQLDSRRCSHDPSIKCTSNATCGGVNTCEFYFGAPLPLAAGGVTTCVFNQFNGPVTGTANVETGEATTTALLTARVYSGIAIDNPCPRCTDAGGINDGVTGGTCDGGTRNGLPCDANGFVPGRPDYGRTSLDCPSISGALLATLPVDLTNATDPVVKTLTAASPNCGPSAVGEKCMCSTCNNAAAEPCFTNADCPPSGMAPGICGAPRCIAGANNGAPCTVASQCPGGLCGRPGEPPRPSACLDDTTTTNILDCVDGGDGEGTCTMGPVDNTCSVASGHAQRGCLNDAACGGAPGSCLATNRKCFLTGGGSFQPVVPSLKVGTDTLIAVGMEDTPVGDVAHPTLGAVFCVGPTGSASINNVAGLPGPGRVTIKGTAVGHP